MLSLLDLDMSFFAAPFVIEPNVPEMFIQRVFILCITGEQAQNNIQTVGQCTQRYCLLWWVQTAVGLLSARPPSNRLTGKKYSRRIFCLRIRLIFCLSIFTFDSYVRNRTLIDCQMAISISIYTRIIQNKHMQEKQSETCCRCWVEHPLNGSYVFSYVWCVTQEICYF